MSARGKRAYLLGVLLLTGAIALWISEAKAGPVRYSMSFSAEFDLIPAGGRAAQRVRLYATPTLVRLERATGEAVFLYDPVKDQTTILFPLKKEYLVVSGPSEVSPFLPLPGGDPCGRALFQVRCRRLGVEPVAGRSAVKWEVGGPRGQLVWVDRELGLVLRRRLRDADLLRARHLRVGPQRPDLFRIPSGYRRTG
ncbi:MAG: hypothetical protein N0A24_11030 [Armatimonadetes bacterium]|nr:hypothetical protein [Armatimonadota bacterium]MDW8154709.1 hypothetical protein [Armatimonadota bacterium]